MVNPVFQRNMKCWKKFVCWQISIGRFSYTVTAKMMLIQMKDERDNQFDPTFRFLRPECLQTFRLIDEASWEVANSAVIPRGKMQSHHNATFLIPICIHRASKKPAGYITKPTRPWQPHTKDRMHPCRATHGSILGLHDAVMLAHVTCVVSYLSCGRERLGQLTRDTEELNMSVLRTRA